MATSTIKLMSESESLATGATLYRVGNIRILRFNSFVYGTGIVVPASDCPSKLAQNVGIRIANNVNITLALVQVAINGGVILYYVPNYNSNGTGVAYPSNGDLFTATVVWEV